VWKRASKRQARWSTIIRCWVYRKLSVGLKLRIKHHERRRCERSRVHPRLIAHSDHVRINDWRSQRHVVIRRKKSRTLAEQVKLTLLIVILLQLRLIWCLWFRAVFIFLLKWFLCERLTLIDRFLSALLVIVLELLMRHVLRGDYNIFYWRLLPIAPLLHSLRSCRGLVWCWLLARHFGELWRLGLWLLKNWLLLLSIVLSIKYKLGLFPSVMTVHRRVLIGYKL
jgi:hypothetical protein